MLSSFVLNFLLFFFHSKAIADVFEERVPVNRDALAMSIANATAFSIIYSYPLISYVQTFQTALSSNGANSISNQNNTATYQSGVLVRPNVDTLYSRAAVDLSQTDVAIMVPVVSDRRFYVFPFYDFYGNNFANIGSVTNSTPGTYLMRQAGNREQGLELVNTTKSEYQGYINFPTTYGFMIVRILLRNNLSDVDAVHEIQRQIKVMPVDRKKTSVAPALTPSLLQNFSLAPAGFQFPGGLSSPQSTELLQLFAKLLRYDPPENRSNTVPLNAIFARAGLTDGTYTPPADLNITQVNTIVNNTIIGALENPSLFVQLSNQWINTQPSASGDFHQNYDIRAYIAWSGYGQLTQTEAQYPEYLNGIPTGSTLAITANQSYILTFSGKPPVTAFWSITIYGADNYLVPNSINRYALGDRSNLTYADGDLVYGDPTSNSPFSILIQPADVPPPANWTNNWLPAPAGGGNFSVNLRWYGPTPALTNGSYAYPNVTKQNAIV